MKPKPEPNDEALADGAANLARLDAQVQAMRTVLVRLLQDVVRAEGRLERGQAAQLVEANQNLVVAALASQADADTSASALHSASQFGALDALTQLPNRSTLLDRFEQAVAHARRHGKPFALLFVDLDNFKQLNDTRGHGFGDQVLRMIANRLTAVVREADTVSRYGGDEFLILLTELGERRAAQAIAEKLIAAVATPTELGGHHVSITASVSIALYPDDGEDIDTLVACADAAMYRSKRQGAGGIAFHDAAPIDGAGPLAPQGVPSPSLDADESQSAGLQRRLAQLREANEKLLLAALSARDMQAAAEQAQQRQTAFLTAVIDELSNPMAPIRIAAKVLGRAPTGEPLLQRVRSIVDQQMTHLSRLLGHVVGHVGHGAGHAVGTSNADGGGLALDHRRVDFSPIIDRAIAAHRPILELREQQFELRRPAGVLDVQGDAVQLEQIVGNLLENASKHTHDGGRVSLSVDVDAGALTMTVADNGIGISTQMLSQVFDPFVQDTRAFGLHGIGLGIGLTVVRALVQAHGGSLAAHSAGGGRGSQFVVTLPLAASGAAAPPEAAAADPASSAR